MTAIELDNQIHIVEARIEQMKEHELYNDNEKRFNISKLTTELEMLLLKKAAGIDVITPEAN